MPNGNIILYALSTCIHCRNAKEFMDEKNIAYDCVYVDSLTGDERQQAVDEVKEFNPALSFPTIVIGDSVVVGFKKDDILKLVGML